MTNRRQLTAHDFMRLLWEDPDWMPARQLRRIVLKAMDATQNESIAK